MKLIQRLESDGTITVTVSWDPHSDPAVVHYTVYAYVEPGNTYFHSTQANVPETSAEVTGLAPNTTYRFFVTATSKTTTESGDKYVESGPSDKIKYNTATGVVPYMNLYYINQSIQGQGFTSAVVAAENEQLAKETHPSTGNIIFWNPASEMWTYMADGMGVEEPENQWPAPSNVTATYLCGAADNATAGTVAHHFTPFPDDGGGTPPADEEMQMWYLNSNRFDGYVDAVVAALNEDDARHTHPSLTDVIVWDDQQSRWEYEAYSDPDTEPQPVSPENAWPAPSEVACMLIGMADAGTTAGAKTNHFTPLGSVPDPNA